MPPTNTFSANTKAKASEINTNFNEVYATWANWVPTLSSSGSWTSTSINLARYTQTGKIILIAVNITGTTAGGTNNLRFTLPVAPLNTTTNYVSNSCFIINVGSLISGTMAYDSGLATMVVRLYNDGGFANGANTGFSGILFYEGA